MRQDLKARLKTRATDLLHKLRQVREGNQGLLQETTPGIVNLFESIYGRGSLQLEQLLEAVKQLRDINPHPGVMDVRISVVLHGYLANLITELDNDLIGRVVERAVGTVIADFVSLAQDALDQNQKDVAAVLASAALEDALKRKAEELEIDVDGKELSDVVNALKATSFFQGPQHKIVTSFVALRNKAMHADWARISKPDVESLVAFIKSFLLEHFVSDSV